MAEEGIDIASEVPSILTTDAVRTADVVITMGCGDACPDLPGEALRGLGLDDPAGQPVRRSAASGTTSRHGCGRCCGS